jgi:hypothetical protein
VLRVHPEFCFPWRPPFTGLKGGYQIAVCMSSKKYIPEKIFFCYFLIKDSNGLAESEGGQGDFLGRH